MEIQKSAWLTATRFFASNNRRKNKNLSEGKSEAKASRPAGDRFQVRRKGVACVIWVTWERQRGQSRSRVPESKLRWTREQLKLKKKEVKKGLQSSLSS